MKEDLKQIEQEIEDIKEFNQTLQQNLESLTKEKNKQDQYQLYLSD